MQKAERRWKSNIVGDEEEEGCWTSLSEPTKYRQGAGRVDRVVGGMIGRAKRRQIDRSRRRHEEEAGKAVNAKWIIVGVSHPATT